MNLFGERFLLPVFASAIVIVAVSNPMKWTLQIRIVTSLALVGAAITIAYFLQRGSARTDIRRSPQREVPPNVEQRSAGNQSPNVNAPGGTVTINNYEAPPKTQAELPGTTPASPPPVSLTDEQKRVITERLFNDYAAAHPGLAERNTSRRLKPDEAKAAVNWIRQKLNERGIYDYGPMINQAAPTPGITIEGGFNNKFEKFRATNSTIEIKDEVNSTFKDFKQTGEAKKDAK